MTIQLARKKINVVIVGRSASKLEEFSKELTTKNSVQVGFLLSFLLAMYAFLRRCPCMTLAT